MSDPLAGNGKGPWKVTMDVDMESFWGDDEAISHFAVYVRPAEKPLAILEKLGSSPFERGQFPFIGFLATTFEKVSQFALERAGYRQSDTKSDI